MIREEEIKAAKDRVPSHVGIEHDKDAMALFVSLHEDVQSIKARIQEKITPPSVRSFVVTTV